MESTGRIASTAGKSGPTSATERVVEGLRGAIVSLELQPGAVLDKSALTKKFGVSRFPIAEALNRLKAEGLVEVRPQSGSTVSRIRLADARENMFLRRALEGEAAAYHAVRRSEPLLAELRRNMRYQKAALAADDQPGFHRLDLEFHDILVTAVGYPRVRTSVEGARLALDRARRLLITTRRHELSYSEHVAIISAIAAGDALAARAAMNAHLGSVMDEIEAFALANPTVFADSE
jgi:GntR family transcriptional regulator, rspAB operon transcriptional repressor